MTFGQKDVLDIFLSGQFRVQEILMKILYLFNMYCAAFEICLI